MTPRIVIHGTGFYGCLIARLAIERGWTIVAALNRSGDKVGQDLGRLIGLDRDLAIVVADCDATDLSGIEADLGVVAQTNQLGVNLPAYRRLMQAGINVACHGTESYYPIGCDPEAAAEIDALARANGVTFTGSGIWDTSRIWSGLLLAGQCTSIGSMLHRSLTAMEGQANPAQARFFGVGNTVEEFHAKRLEQNRLYRSYKTVPEHVLAALGYTIADTRVRVDPVVWQEDFDCTGYLGEVIPAGRCVGTRVVGEIDTAEGVTGRIEFEARPFAAGDVEHMDWEVAGLPRARVRVEREDSAHATAANLLNRIPQIIAAPPGIQLVSALGPMRHSAQ